MALIKCPECGKEISDQAASCPNCGFVVNGSPAKKPSEKLQSKKYNGCLVLVGFVLFLFIGARYCNSNSIDPTTEAKIESQYKDFDNAVANVKEYLRNNLKDPKSYESVEWSEVVKRDDGGFKIRHKYRAKNSFGGYALENKVFFISQTGRIENVVDYNE